MKENGFKKGLNVMILAAGIACTSSAVAYASEIPNGIYVGSQNLGGMTLEEASKTVEEYVAGLAGQKITLDVSGTSVETTASDLGFHWNNQDVLQETAQSYENLNIVQRYLAFTDLEVEPLNIKVETAVDEAMVSAFVEERCAGLTAQPQDAVITRVDGQFVITPSVKGVVVDVAATSQALNTAMAAGLDNPVTAAAVVTESEPARTTEDLETIQDVLGTFSTDFSSSGNSRSTNLRVGSGKINGTVLMPGEVLSGYELMHPFTTANGYATAAAYENGQVVDSVGGGVCQISTTLYNAALLSEMEIVQRQNHSMVINYVKPSMDAAIAGTYKDLKFKNPYDTPIYVEGYTSGKTLTFTIYGKETRPGNRTIKYVSETLSVTDPGEPIKQVDPTLAPGATRRVQSSHRGVRSRLWKYVYIDGVEKEKTLLYTDTYNASKAIVKVGPEIPVTVPVPDVAPPVETPAETAAPVTGVDGGPGVSPAPMPETSPAPTPEPAPVPDPAPVPEVPAA